MKYIKSEISRTFRSPNYKYFLFFSIGVTILSLLVWNVSAGPDADYFTALSVFAEVAILIVSSFALIIAY